MYISFGISCCESFFQNLNLKLKKILTYFNIAKAWVATRNSNSFSPSYQQ
jgi:hypothetical protein